MIFIVLILLFIMISSARVAEFGSFMDGYMSKQNTCAVKGVFVLLVLLGHASSYVKLGGIWDQPYIDLRLHLDQMVVSMFLFYSGYGMMKSIMKNGFQYIREIPLKRFLIVLINFDIAVLLFVIMYFCMGKTFDISTILWSLIGWKSVGNSNWYMFAIFTLYILLFLSFYIIKWCDKKIILYGATVLFTLFTIVFVYWEIRVGQPTWCYNTVILFPFGLWYALLQKPIESILLRNDYLYSMFCTVFVVAYWFSFQHRWSGGIEYYTVWAVMFTILVVCFTMKISFHSRVLMWFGEHVFSVYILQRIPMIILSKLGISAERYAFIVLTLLITIFISLVFDYFITRLDKLILGKMSLEKTSGNS